MINNDISELFENNCYTILLEKEFFSLKDVNIFQEESTEKFYFLFNEYNSGNLDIDFNLIFDEEKIKKGIKGKLKYFTFNKVNFPSDLTGKGVKISLNPIMLKDLNLSASFTHRINNNLICIYNTENLIFFKLLLNNSELILKPYSKKINLKSILFPDENPEDIMLDINYLKTVREDCLFISTLQNPKDEDKPANNFINSNLFIKFNPENPENDLHITYFIDSYYPNDDYNFKNRPVFEASDSLYNNEIFFLTNSQDKLIEYFSFEEGFEENEYLINHPDIEDKYKFCLPKIETEKNSDKNSLPIGFTIIDFKFPGYDKDQIHMEGDEIQAPFLILLLDNDGRLFFGYVINTHIVKTELKGDNDNLNLIMKGHFIIKLDKDMVSKENLNNLPEAFKNPNSNKKINLPPQISLFDNIKNDNDNNKNDNNKSNEFFHKNANNFYNEKNPKAEIKNLFGDNSAKNISFDLFSNKNKEPEKINQNQNNLFNNNNQNLINIEANNDNDILDSMEKYFNNEKNQIKLENNKLFDNTNKNKDNTQNLFQNNLQDKDKDKEKEKPKFSSIFDLPSSNLSFEKKRNKDKSVKKEEENPNKDLNYNVLYAPINIEPNIQQNYNKINQKFSNVNVPDNNNNNIKIEPKENNNKLINIKSNINNCNENIRKQIIIKSKSSIEKKEKEIFQESENLNLEKFEEGKLDIYYEFQKKSISIKREEEEKQKIYFKEKEKIMQTEIEKFKAEKQIEKSKIEENLEIQKKKLLKQELENAEIEKNELKKSEKLIQEKEKALSKIKENLKEKTFNQNKKNLICNMKIYSELISEKVSDFQEKIKEIIPLNNKINENKKLFDAMENKIEEFCAKKNQVKKKVEDFYSNNFQANVNYYSERMNNLIKILQENEKEFDFEEKNIFILNNQQRPSNAVYENVKKIKENYENLFKKFVEKIKNFNKFIEDCQRLNSRLANNEQLNDKLAVYNSYIGPMEKFKVNYFSSSSSSNFNPNDDRNRDAKEYKKTFSFNKNQKNDAEGLRKNENDKPFEENMHRNIYNDIMIIYENEYNSIITEYNDLTNKFKEFIAMKNMINKDKDKNNTQMKTFSGHSIASNYKILKKNNDNNNNNDNKVINLIENNKTLNNYLKEVKAKENTQNSLGSGEDLENYFSNYKKEKNLLKNKQNQLIKEKQQQEIQLKFSKELEISKNFEGVFLNLNEIYGKYHKNLDRLVQKVDEEAARKSEVFEEEVEDDKIKEEKERIKKEEIEKIKEIELQEKEIKRLKKIEEQRIEIEKLRRNQEENQEKERLRKIKEKEEEEEKRQIKEKEIELEKIRKKEQQIKELEKLKEIELKKNEIEKLKKIEEEKLKANVNANPENDDKNKKENNIPNSLLGAENNIINNKNLIKINLNNDSVNESKNSVQENKEKDKEKNNLGIDFTKSSLNKEPEKDNNNNKPQNNLSNLFANANANANKSNPVIDYSKNSPFISNANSNIFTNLIPNNTNTNMQNNNAANANNQNGVFNNASANKSSWNFAVNNNSIASNNSISADNNNNNNASLFGQSSQLGGLGNISKPTGAIGFGKNINNQGFNNSSTSGFANIAQNNNNNSFFNQAPQNNQMGFNQAQNNNNNQGFFNNNMQQQNQKPKGPDYDF